MNTDKILDDAREKIAKKLAQHGVFDLENEILNLSGTTDIECPECEGTGGSGGDCGFPGYNCEKCGNSGVIKHEWELGVHLKNGELPEIPEWAYGKSPKLDAEITQHDMISAGYVQEVKE